ncbi:hypothetical protein EDD21DRAFT_406796 [Dissophora ornata]|nr:hypothetical protein EDD21DRAFT_406796 [Dissophora ornata]
MPKALLETRKNVRHDIRPFYLVEVVLDKQIKQNEELQNMAEVQPWNTRPQKARDYDNKDAVVAQEARAAGDVHANNQATEPRPKAKPSESGANTETENGTVTTASILSKGALRAKAASTKIKISNKEAWYSMVEAWGEAVT